MNSAEAASEPAVLTSPARGNFRGSAGDCTGEPYQTAKAVGEGQVAALRAVRYLRELTKDTPTGDTAQPSTASDGGT